MKKKFVILFLVLFLLFFLIFIFYPRLNIGKKIENIDVFTEYNNKVNAYNLVKKFKVKISDNTNYKKLGQYKIKYRIKFLFITKTKTKIINIVDRENPIIKLENDINKICKNIDLKLLKYNAIDNYDGDITDKVEVKLMENKLTYIVKDSSDNTTSLTKKIEYINDNKPTIKLKGSTNLYLYQGSKYIDPGYIAVDECDGDITDKVTVEGNVNTNRVGKYKITYKILNSNNNEVVVSRNVIIIKGKNITNSSGNGKIYLTFDDGPSKSITSKLLDILKEENVKGTFFVTNKSSTLDYLIKREYTEGHTVGLHSATHNYETVYKSSDAYFNDLSIISNKVKTITGNDSKIIRFPGGSSNTVSKKYQQGIMTYLTNEVKKRGYIYFDWNISSGDAGGTKTSDNVYNNVTKKLSKNKTNIVLLHDYENNYKTLNAIRDIIKFGKDNGYIFEVITKDTPQITHHVNN